jgi:hypothetical protein
LLRGVALEWIVVALACLLRYVWLVASLKFNKIFLVRLLE